MKDKQAYTIEMEPSKALFLEEMARQHDLPDIGKAMRCLINYARENPDRQAEIFSVLRCLDC